MAKAGTCLCICLQSFPAAQVILDPPRLVFRSDAYDADYAGNVKCANASLMADVVANEVGSWLPESI